MLAVPGRGTWSLLAAPGSPEYLTALVVALPPHNPKERPTAAAADADDNAAAAAVFAFDAAGRTGIWFPPQTACIPSAGRPDPPTLPPRLQTRRVTAQPQLELIPRGL
eukprot:evm.model.NODE_31921_length_33497_cov_50.621609.3